MSKGVSLDITCKISKAQIRKAIKQGGSLWSNLISPGARALPYATSALSKVVPALATGAMSVLGSFGIDKISGKGVQQAGFLTRPNKIKQLINYRHSLTAGQKKQILDALQRGGRLVINPIKTQRGGFFGTLLASIGVPMLLNALTGRGLNVARKSRGGKGLSVSRGPGMSIPYQKPPFLGTWGNPVGMGVKEDHKKQAVFYWEKTIRSTQFRF